MDERPDQILNHIEAQRDELGRNLNELETRVKQSTDWRTYFDRNPMMMLGAALGGGLLLGSMVGGGSVHRMTGRRSKRIRGAYSTSSNYSSENYTGLGASAAGFAAADVSGSSSSSSSYPGSSSSYSEAGSTRSNLRSSMRSSESVQQLARTMEQVKTALISFGIAKTNEFLSEAFPGFDQHMQQAAEKGHGGQGSHEHQHRHGDQEHGHSHSHEQGPSHEHSHQAGSFGQQPDWQAQESNLSGTQTSGYRGSHEGSREPMIVTPT
jgi:hypothetical protein